MAASRRKEDVINEFGLSVTEVAEHLKISRVSLSRFLNKRTGMSLTLALRLEMAGISTAQAWRAMQLNQDRKYHRQPITQRLSIESHSS
ncbi:HigA family addiction module antitoxin [Candidatus Williamhamiltonella defendens]|uniref:Addiction module antidote protein, HigA family n=3 Tax=Candidatus Williamhamiltonella defendens TaxID=138072 RepID=A0A249DZX8_9ENTR|nr:HigA family addiction module antitoxin [Candidatus Hamiltonella defensa]ASX26991.1 addiction module antidote protein, HigA family [Candidatus Hamiltonella defensa (Bemisia tabaci)]